MANYVFAWDSATVLAAASGACAKVIGVVFNHGVMGDMIFETDDDMTAGEIAAVKAAVQALTQDLVEES
jgi:hypothetical protein